MHLPKQTVLPFSRKDRVLNRQIRQRAERKKVTPGLGRPPTPGGTGRVEHKARQPVTGKVAVHCTLRLNAKVPSLRSRRRFGAVKAAFAKVRSSLSAFRVVHFAVLSNHVHVLVEADSNAALSSGMQTLAHAMSRRLNALSVREAGGVVRRGVGGYSKAPGWLGRVFADRYHAHILKSPTEMHNALRYVFDNANRHYGYANSSTPDPFSSFASTPADAPLTHRPRGYLLARTLRTHSPP